MRYTIEVLLIPIVCQLFFNGINIGHSLVLPILIMPMSIICQLRQCRPLVNLLTSVISCFFIHYVNVSYLDINVCY